MNGETTLQSIIQCVQEEIERKPATVTSIHPICFVFLDYNMTDRTGLNILNDILNFYRVMNEILQAEGV